MSKIKQHISQQFLKDCKIKYPNLIPVYVQSQAQQIKLRKSKFLISQNLSGIQFLKKLNTNLTKSVPCSTFLYINHNSKYKSLPQNDKMKDVYSTYKNDVGYLHIVIFSQNPY